MTTEPVCVTLGSVWTNDDHDNVVVVVGLDDAEWGVLAEGWVSYGVRGTAVYETQDQFVSEYPECVFRVKH